MSCDTTDQIIHTRPLQIRDTAVTDGMRAWNTESS